MVVGFSVDDILISPYGDSVMPRKKVEGSARQVYASIREDLYLAAKGRSAELRLSLREFIESALELALSGAERPSKEAEQPSGAQAAPSVWDDEYLRMQVQQPLGSPVELTKEEAEKVVRGAFGMEADQGAEE